MESEPTVPTCTVELFGGPLDGGHRMIMADAAEEDRVFNINGDIYLLRLNRTKTNYVLQYVHPGAKRW